MLERSSQLLNQQSPTVELSLLGWGDEGLTISQGAVTVEGSRVGGASTIVRIVEVLCDCTFDTSTGMCLSPTFCAQKTDFDHRLGSVWPSVSGWFVASRPLS